MGCCCSSESADDSEAGDVNERTALLADQQRLTGSGESGAEPPAETAPRTGETGRTRGDGETLLDGILQDMAASVIDVAAVDTPNLEQQDYVERCRQYSGALARLGGPPARPLAVQDVPPALAQRLLAEPPVRPEEALRARQTAERLLEAVRAVQVAPGESLVIPFGQTAGGEP